MRLTYREGPDEFYYDLPIYNNTLQFNQITLNRQGTSLQALAFDEVLPSELSNQETYLMGGVGLAIKITFPTLDKLTELGPKVVFSHAELRLEPVRGTILTKHPCLARWHCT
ncbi:MAG: hypothetical protein HC880_22390 [Bacteroidia bacterium]|nr:hypothetical protein [Bacteroidia bacterium]